MFCFNFGAVSRQDFKDSPRPSEVENASNENVDWVIKKYNKMCLGTEGNITDDGSNNLAGLSRSWQKWR